MREEGIAMAEITNLPLTGEVRAEFIGLANREFERVLARIEAERPEATRRLWDAEHYIDNVLLGPNMLPIDQDYALSLIESFLVHHVIKLARTADEMENDTLH